MDTPRDVVYFTFVILKTWIYFYSCDSIASAGNLGVCFEDCWVYLLLCGTSHFKLLLNLQSVPIHQKLYVFLCKHLVDLGQLLTSTSIIQSKAILFKTVFCYGGILDQITHSNGITLEFLRYRSVLSKWEFFTKIRAVFLASIFPWVMKEGESNEGGILMKHSIWKKPEYTLQVEHF